MKKFILFFVLSVLLGNVTLAQNWEVIKSNTNEELNAVHFPSVSVGYIAGAYGTILKTVNGGNSWILLNSGTDKTLYDIYFTSNTTGFAIGDYSKIIKTTDGGQSWVEKMSDPAYNFYSMYFLNDQTGFIAGNWGSIPCVLKTTDGGETWVQKTIHEGVEYDLESICFVNVNTGFAIGYKYDGGKYYGRVLKTTDGGNTWQSLDVGGVSWLSDVFFTGINNGIAVGFGGKIVKTAINANNIQNTGKDISFLPYPNPTKSFITLPYQCGKGNIVEIFNSNGQPVETKQIEYRSDKVVLNISNYAKGIYFYKHNAAIYKFMVE